LQNWQEMSVPNYEIEREKARALMTYPAQRHLGFMTLSACLSILFATQSVMLVFL